LLRYFKLKYLGAYAMSVKLIDFKEIKILDAKLIGKEIRCIMDHPNGNPIPEFWMNCFADDTFKVLDNPDRIFNNVMIGWCGNFDAKDNTFSYIVGGFVKKSFLTPGNFKTINFTETDFVSGTLKGTEPEIYQKSYELTKEEALKKNLSLNENSGYVMEWYDQRFDPDDIEKIIELLIPLLK
jgi:predicted transcriptional regulator YdeE